jgi:hypothetical protein
LVGLAEVTSAEIVVGLFVALAFDGLGLTISIKDHSGKSTIIAFVTPPTRCKDRLGAMGAMTRRRLTSESGLKSGYGAAEYRKCVHMTLLITC